VRHRAILNLAAASLGLFAAVSFLSRSSEPVYRGKSLSLWIKTYQWPDNPTVNDLFPRPAQPVKLPDDDLVFLGPEARRRKEAAELERRQTEAAEAVRQIGPNAIPALLEDIDCDPGFWRYKLCDALPRTLSRRRLPQWLLVSGTEQRIGNGITGFWILGERAAAAVPELTRRMQTRTSRSANMATLALAKIGPAGLQALVHQLEDTNALKRVYVARIMDEAIQNSGTNNASAGVQALARCLRDNNIAVGTWSAITLAQPGMDPTIAVPALAKGLNDPRPQVRQRCAASLSSFGAAALPAASLLRNCSNDPDASVRAAALDALSKIVPQTNRLGNISETIIH
jgi:hypothetical protein